MPKRRQFFQKAVLARMGKFMQAGWFIQGDNTSNASRKTLVIFNVLANVTANLIGGNFFTGLLIVLEADDAFVGLTTMLTFGANILQLISPYLWERFENRKPLLIAFRILLHLINIAFIGLIPFMPVTLQTRLVFLGFSIFLVNLIGAIIGPGMSVWHIAHVPSSVRVQYFSLLSLLNGVFVAIFNLLGSDIVDHFRDANQEIMGLVLLRILAFLLAVFEIIMLCRIKELPRKNHSQRIRLRTLFSEPWKHPVYLRSVLVVALWSMVVNLPGSFYTVYMLRELKVSYSYITLVSTMNVLVLLSLTWVWRRVFLKHNWLKPLSWAIIALAPHYAVLAFVSPGLMFLYPLGVLWSNICSCGINLAFSSVSFINLPENNQTVFIGFYSTCNFLAGFLAASLARAFVSSLQGLHFSLIGVPFGEKQLLMLLVGVLMLGAGFAVRFIWRINVQQGLEH